MPELTNKTLEAEKLIKLNYKIGFLFHLVTSVSDKDIY